MFFEKFFCQVCTPITEKVCKDLPKKSCSTVFDKKCHTKTEQVCTQVPVEPPVKDPEWQAVEDPEWQAVRDPEWQAVRPSSDVLPADFQPIDGIKPAFEAGLLSRSDVEHYPSKGRKRRNGHFRYFPLKQHFLQVARQIYFILNQLHIFYSSGSIAIEGIIRDDETGEDHHVVYEFDEDHENAYVDDESPDEIVIPIKKARVHTISKR